MGGVQMDAFEARVQPLLIGFFQGDFGLGAQRGQRRTDLVGGIRRTGAA
jgi:hypothetical protein